MTVQFTLVGADDGSQYISAFVPGSAPLVAHDSHPNFQDILDGCLNGDESVVDLFDVSLTAASRFEAISERVTVSNGRVYLDGDEIDNALTKQIIRFMQDGVTDWIPLVNFFENVQANPQEHSREQLYEWLSRRDFTITADGLIVGYKGVAKNERGEYCSVSSGKATVDGETFTGHIPNPIGAVVEMPRSAVAFNPSVGCSTGLHVGNYRYASNFGQYLLEVHVNPRDVVSVPTDSDWEKVRVCRYQVVGEIDREYDVAVLYFNDIDEDEDYEWGEYDY